MIMYEDNPSVEHDALEPREGWLAYWIPFLRWTPSGPRQLQQAEEQLLKHLTTPSLGFYVNVGQVGGTPCRIWTRVYTNDTTESELSPLVMCHGMGAGSALWSLNIDHLCQHSHRTIINIDLPGFARSSRCKMSSDPAEVEAQYVMCLELWRKALGFDKIILLGHSFGGYLSACYALQYPDHLERLVLVDPWGMTEKPSDVMERYNPSLAIKILFRVVKHLNPLWGLRVSGPIGPRLIPRFRPDMVEKFASLVGEDNASVIPGYIYHCNAHDPTGEAAFHSLCDDFFWAKSPLLARLSELKEDLLVTAVYGEDSWVTRVTESDLHNAGVKRMERFNVVTIPAARHHVYADQHEIFNAFLVKTLEKNKKPKEPLFSL